MNIHPPAQNRLTLAICLTPISDVMKSLRFSLSLVACACIMTTAQAQTSAAEALAYSPELLFAVAPATPSAASDPTRSERMGPWGFDLSGRDLKAKPGDDFFQWANGEWSARTVIPADRARYGNFDALAALSLERVRSILESAATAKAPDRETQKISAAWRSFMDEAAAEKLDASPLKPALNDVRKAQSLADITRLMGRAKTTPYRSVFNVSVRDDAKNPERYAIYLGTGGLGLPDRDYYLEARFADKKAAYEKYVAQLLEMLQWPEAQAAARALVAMETRIAEVTWSRAEQRNRDKTYNPMTLAELQAFAPGFQWSEFLNEAGLANPARLVLTTNTAFPKVAAIYRDTPLQTLQAWMAFHAADSAAPMLSKRFTQAHFQFRSATLAGQPEEKPRWKRGVDFVNATMGEAVGQQYVARYFPAQSKEMMAALVVNVRSAMQKRIESLDWMGADTKVQALAKLSKFGVKIGYPDVWRDYTALEVKDNDLYGNSLRSQAFEWQHVVSRLNQKVDKTEWGMTPQTVNAYYNPVKNEIVFPAAILQPPFFDPLADAAINYGGIGAVIGHEVSHGFDDQGRKSDGDGYLRDWWTAQDAAKFQVQSQKLGEQYSSFEPLPGAKVNGALTMGENIGDLGGLSVALEAYQISLAGKPAAIVDGTTGVQRVFLGWAQVWRNKSRDEALRQQLVSDPHSPAYFRVNGTVRNMDAWYQAFDVKPGDKLFVAPADRVRIW